MNIEGVHYDVNWVAFKPGLSMFFVALKPEKAKEEIQRQFDRMRISVEMKAVIHEGVMGVRVWRK